MTPPNFSGHKWVLTEDNDETADSCIYECELCGAELTVYNDNTDYMHFDAYQQTCLNITLTGKPTEPQLYTATIGRCPTATFEEAIDCKRLAMLRAIK
jgi:hypothetical protein